MSSFYTSNVIVHGCIAPRDRCCLTFVALEAGKELMYTRTSFFSSLLLIEAFQ